ncbi:hypothetical protein TNCV_5041861 [Trichonephila clavipes]|nr:hypothetical protein TNCV_5041861 [Trichonephila clavipes]
MMVRRPIMTRGSGIRGGGSMAGHSIRQHGFLFRASSQGHHYGTCVDLRKDLLAHDSWQLQVKRPMPRRCLA